MYHAAGARTKSDRARGCGTWLSRLVRHQREKLADSEFRQSVDNNQLHVVITHKFSAGEVYEEHSQFRQEPELIQEKWSWRESKHGRSQRECAADFLTGIASAHIRQDHKDVSKRINIEPGRTFAGFGFSLALANLRKRL